MRVIKKRSNFMPCLNSYFITDFDFSVSEAIKSTRGGHIGGDKYIGKGTWEVTEEVWNLIKHFPHTLTDESEPSPTPLVLEIREDNPGGKYAYQDIAASELQKRENCLLFFDTGTGKTRTALLALSRLSRDSDAAIIVGEANLSQGWLSQVEKHFPASLDRFLILNDGRSIPKRIKAIEGAPKGTIFIVNIESVRNKAFVDALNGRDLAVCVLDECQYITGATAQQTAGMLALKSHYRWALSATPVRNTPLEWYSLLAWLRVIMFNGTKTRFKEYYSFAHRNEYGEWLYFPYRHEQDLEDLKNLVTIRVEKSGLGLPPRTVLEKTFEMDADLCSILSKIKAEKIKDWIKATFRIANRYFIATSAPSLFYIERVATALQRDKIDFVLNQTEEPMIVVSSLKFPLDYLHSLIGSEAALYHGDIPKEEREQNKSDFISGKKRVLLMTRKSGGTGLDGLQSRARIMVFLDAPENSSNFNQCADRLHRVGQQNEVIIYLLKVKGSIDIYAWNNMDSKQGWLDRYYKVNYGNLLGESDEDR